jgi:hypothetical protein
MGFFYFGERVNDVLKKTAFEEFHEAQDVFIKVERGGFAENPR